MPKPRKKEPIQPTHFRWLLCEAQGITHCEQVSKGLLMAYAAWLDDEGYAYATEYLEIHTLKQLVRFLVEEQHLHATALIKLPMKKPARHAASLSHNRARRFSI